MKSEMGIRNYSFLDRIVPRGSLWDRIYRIINNKRNWELIRIKN
jgi:hypothetical protein